MAWEGGRHGRGSAMSAVAVRVIMSRRDSSHIMHGYKKVIGMSRIKAKVGKRVVSLIGPDCAISTSL